MNPKYDIVNIITHALRSAPGSFESVANGSAQDVKWGADYMPEYWIVCTIMKAIHEQGLAALPELNISRDVHYFEVNGKELNFKDFDESVLKGAKIDLFIGEKSENQNHMKLRAVLEIKGKNSAWDRFANDLNRLKKIKQALRCDEVVVMFAYVTAPVDEKGRIKEEKDLLKHTGRDIKDFSVESAYTSSIYESGMRSYIYKHEVN